MFRYLVAFTALLLILFAGCKDEPTKSEAEDTPGSRNYTWTVDTFNIPFNLFRRISGSSTDNVWAVGAGGALSTTIYHFDGKKWNCDSISRPIAPSVVYAVSSNDVWIGDAFGLIWHYNGRTWSYFTKLEISGYSYICIQNLWGDAPNNIFAVGSAVESSGNYKSCLFHYDGSSWKPRSIPDMELGTLTSITRDPSKNNIYYLDALKLKFDGGYDSSFIYEYNGNSMNKIYGVPTWKESVTKTNVLNGKLYIMIGNRLVRYENGSYKNVYEFKNPEYYNAFMGRSTKDIFFMAKDGIIHYNGSDEQYLYRIDKDRITFNGTAQIEDQVFFLAYDTVSDLNLIIRGKLN